MLTQARNNRGWIPIFTGMTGKGAGMAREKI
jgi:hypothetical protein